MDGNGHRIKVARHSVFGSSKDHGVRWDSVAAFGLGRRCCG
jgi:hypothetical protein